MKIVRKGEGRTEQGKTFTGNVVAERIIEAQTQDGVAVSLIRFEDGAVTHWHEHPGEQVLVIIDGKGRIGNESEQHDLEIGDMVHTGPGERHWHGAARGHSMAHISITTKGSPTWYEAPE